MSRLVPHTLRGRLALAALLVTGVWVALLTLAFSLILTNRLAVQADDTLRTRAGAVAALVTVTASGTVVIATPADGRAINQGIWVYAGGKAVRRPPGDAGLQRAADRLARSGGGFTTPDGDRLTRLYAQPVTIGGRRVATVLAAIDLDAYSDAARLAMVGSAVTAVLLLVLMYATIRVVVARALRPVEQMARQAADWSVHDLDHRFGPANRPTELERLAMLLDELLARQAAVVRSDQRLTAELSHELRTPLTVLAAEVELLRSRPRSPAELDAAHAGIAAGIARMSGLLETLLTEARGRARSVPGRCALGEALGGLVERAQQAGWATAGDRAAPRVTLRPAPAPGLTAGVDPDVLERIVSPLLDNARRHARAEVTLSASVGYGVVSVMVADDGPGVPDGLGERIFEPGFSAAGDDDRVGGAGLGLALARRLARGIGGDVSLGRGEGGLFVVTLPPG